MFQDAYMTQKFRSLTTYELRSFTYSLPNSYINQLHGNLKILNK